LVDHSAVRKAWLTATVLLAAFVLTASAAALGPRASLPPGWSHAEINVVIKGQPHTLTYDRGRVTSVGPSSLTLRERDGSIVTINVSTTTRITITGQPASLAQVRPLEQATSVSIDGGPAATLDVRIPPLVAAILARQARRGNGQ
jgi:hypothetical protein